MLSESQKEEKKVNEYKNEVIIPLSRSLCGKIKNPREKHDMFTSKHERILNKPKQKIGDINHHLLKKADVREINMNELLRKQKLYWKKYNIIQSSSFQGSMRKREKSFLQFESKIRKFISKRKDKSSQSSSNCL